MKGQLHENLRTFIYLCSTPNVLTHTSRKETKSKPHSTNLQFVSPSTLAILGLRNQFNNLSLHDTPVSFDGSRNEPQIFNENPNLSPHYDNAPVGSTMDIEPEAEEDLCWTDDIMLSDCTWHSTRMPSTQTTTRFTWGMEIVSEDYC